MPFPSRSRGIDRRRARDSLVALSRRAGEPLAADLAELLEDQERRDELLDAARVHRVAGLLLQRLDSGGVLARLAPPRRRELVFLLLKERRRTALFGAELEVLARILEERGTDFVVLKGAALRTIVFDDPVQRHLGDLDILVAPDRVNRTIELLLERGYENPWSPQALEGYRIFHYHIPLVRRDGLVVEVHWGLAKPARPYALDAEEFLAHRVPLPGGAPRFPIPCPEHLLLHVALQQLQDGFAYLSRSVDLDRILHHWTDLDWDRVIGTAHAGHLGPAVAMSLQLAHRLMGTDVPREALRELGPARPARLHLALMRPEVAALNQRFNRHPTAYRLLRFWLTPGSRQRREVLIHSVIGEEDHQPLRRPWELGRAGGAPGPSAARRLWSLVKLAAYQTAVYLVALRALGTRAGRRQMRFWSSQRNSSERL